MSSKHRRYSLRVKLRKKFIIFNSEKSLTFSKKGDIPKQQTVRPHNLS